MLAILDGQHALSKVGRRLDERGMVTLLQPGLTRAALHDHRLGHILDALCAANLNGVFSAIALQALEVYAIATPWLHQDTTTIVLYGGYEDDPSTPGAPRPAYGHSKDGRGDLKQVLLSLGVSGDGGLPLRLGQKLRSRSDPLQCWQSHTRAPEDETALELPPGAMRIKPFTFHDERRHQT